MFCIKGFAAGQAVGLFIGFGASATGASAIAANIAPAKHGMYNVGPQTFGTGRVRRERLINAAGSERIDKSWHQFALWIKVPLIQLPVVSSRRCFVRPLAPKPRVNKAIQFHGFMITECFTASFASGPVDLWILFIGGGDFS
jgi:hypothetical protein